MMIVRTAAAIPAAFTALALMALAVMMTEGHDEVRRWWAAQ